LKLMRYVIANIDENGWLTSPSQGEEAPPAVVLEELARNYEEPVTVAQVEEALLLGSPVFFADLGHAGQYT